MNPLVVVGAGLAGYNLLKEFRKLDKERPIVVICSDDGRNYSKPMLSTGFTKSKSADQLAMADAAKMAETFNAEIRAMATVSAVDAANKTITVDGEVLEYSDLVLAQGAEVFQPPVEGDALDQVYTVNDLMDYGRFRTALEGKKKVVIVGAGLIGCEFANDLRNGEFEVAVVDPAGRCLPQLLPEPASEAVARGLQDAGVGFYFGPFVKAVNAASDGVEVVLSDGQSLAADIVISAVGLRPRIALAQAAGLSVDRGINVDTQLRTADANIYALGDCAQVNGHVMLYVLPLMASARALAKTLSGTPTDVAYGVMPVSVKTPACPVVVCPAPLGLEGEWKSEVDGNSVKSLFYSNDGELRGFALTGECISEKMALAKQLPAVF